MRRPARSLTALLCAGALSAALGGCGSTLQDEPIPHNTLESLIAAPVPVYWLGGSFHGLAISEASQDPSGAYTLQYGNCVQAGQGTCVPPLRIVTTPNNSFLPGSSSPPAHGTPQHAEDIRGLSATVAQEGKMIVIATGPVVVDIYAASAQLAAAAAHTAVPINQASAPDSPLPPPLPNTGFGERALRAQEPPPLHPLG